MAKQNLVCSASLALWASKPHESRGRLFVERESPGRSDFERDRDRIVHAVAFRRLKDKTQVFLSHEGDHFRTRLTHSLEVAQIARSIARRLALNEDLAESLALAHDLGHPPFGHAGERALNQLLAPYGGFDHNAHTIHIVTHLERHYAAFDGLNLSWETIEGLVKHNGPLIDMHGQAVGKFAQAGIPEIIRSCAERYKVDLSLFGGPEAQVASFADDIAYYAHDIDDGLRAELFDIIDLGDVPMIGGLLAQLLKMHPKIERSRLIYELNRLIITHMVTDVIGQAQKNFDVENFTSADAIRCHMQPVICFSPQMQETNRILKSFLHKHMYHHDRIERIMVRAQRIIFDLFEAYQQEPYLLPKEWHLDAPANDTPHFARWIGDFIAGMTDRYAIDQHKRLFDISL